LSPKIGVRLRKYGKNITPAAKGHGLFPWMSASAFGRNLAPLGREVGFHGLCPAPHVMDLEKNWHFLSTYRNFVQQLSSNRKEKALKSEEKILFILWHIKCIQTLCNISGNEKIWSQPLDSPV
jgi:hypothetical protein